VVPLAPHLVRITLAGAALRGFDSQSFDDHVKVFFPREGSDEPLLPVIGADGAAPSQPGAERPIARDFTPRRFDRHAGELDLEFVLHDTGPATRWAAQARPGHRLGIGGPRGSMIIPLAFDWHLLMGDETALPAIARRLEELPAHVHAIVLVEVDGPADEIPLQSRAAMQLTWLHRCAAQTVLTGLQSMAKLPRGEGYAWAAAESSHVRQIRQHLLDLGMDKSRIRAASYWKHGAPATHEVIDD
jgi:NADPH-dependent ferric siderophore reductase